ncbi:MULTISPECIES: helix-turn-helix domain-containing protein [Amycolatopsis]|uniref:Helix-turn-helix transcriptional regulator n=1 Tax=Amycolatopsis thermalba TaxID=944492 RepID=A0ABY4NS69_9PSEU|nr:MULTISPECIES: helix-turn-helix transcriptional regulator [Amycolatopsis]OXM68976.1 transcriptional regulator [Amycolatopsis sp. KNN50.9b]UQS22904.1 helix-turn-helix transcriptional regulator [Amycolatopsis thermalba]
MAEVRLGEFLQSRRARVTPESVGLRPGSRRRVPGLRREELAQLAGISVEYYQRLEQGRASHPSDEVLNAIADTLRLDAVERDHLRALARPPRHGTRAAESVRPQLRRMLDLIDLVPALVINDRFDVLAANALAHRLFGEARNLARTLFLDPAARDRYVEWEEVAAATAAQLRLAVGRHPHDEDLAALVAELSARSEEFRRWWHTGDVELRAFGTKSFRHPGAGVLTFHYENFELPGDTRQRLVTLTPAKDSTTEAALRLLSAAAP